MRLFTVQGLSQEGAVCEISSPVASAVAELASSSLSGSKARLPEKTKAFRGSQLPVGDIRTMHHGYYSDKTTHPSGAEGRMDERWLSSADPQQNKGKPQSLNIDSSKVKKLLGARQVFLMGHQQQNSCTCSESL